MMDNSENDWIPMTIAGVCLCVLGFWLMRLHVRTWGTHASDESLDEREQKHYRSQYRRRMQTSGIIALLGVMVFVGDVVLPRVLSGDDFTRVFGFYWLGVLLLTLWVVVLACGDIASIRVHSQTSLAHNRRKQRALEEQLEEMKSRGSNGNAASN